MPRVAIVVVTHQSADVIEACLDAINAACFDSGAAHLDAKAPDIEVIVIDNASSDFTCGKVSVREIRLIANSNNAGFAGAVNQGVRATSAPLILLLNPDTRLETGIESLIRVFDDPGTGGAGGLLTGPDGLPQTGFMARSLPTPTALIFENLGINRLWPTNPVNWHYRCLGVDPLVPGAVDQPAGAFFMFRRSAWDRLGGFDERFWPVWFEDVDFCARLLSEGYSVRYCTNARATHQGGHSVGAIPLEIKEKYWYGSLLKYAAKHYRPVAFGLVCLSVAAGAAGRAVFGFPRGGLRVTKVYFSVIRLSISRLLGPQRRV
jgi:N-acetylglucosaminyl-diphospho-decaprenol L-rhamnosyltransferase